MSSSASGSPNDGIQGETASKKELETGGEGCGGDVEKRVDTASQAGGWGHDD